ncbi:hypothetical protein EVAR_53982_1 [Eumeta japonica]|uniref:Uncharacterized protein n=1 Tax=Eumeta variegata TaxID=151549 RepID=A0A4C1YUY3_EUMVA|nr:hypothetical protein EVAR_53982_1 [Eumeta japonica]
MAGFIIVFKRDRSGWENFIRFPKIPIAEVAPPRGAGGRGAEVPRRESKEFRRRQIYIRKGCFVFCRAADRPHCGRGDCRSRG